MLGQQGLKLGLVLDEPLGAIAFAGDVAMEQIVPRVKWLSGEV
jgi:hypothetical protein